MLELGQNALNGKFKAYETFAENKDVTQTF